MTFLSDARQPNKFVQNHGSRVPKVHFRLTPVAQKRRCLSSLLAEGRWGGGGGVGGLEGSAPPASRKRIKYRPDIIKIFDDVGSVMW